MNITQGARLFLFFSQKVAVCSSTCDVVSGSHRRYFQKATVTHFSLQCSLAKPQTIFRKGYSYVVQLAVIIRDVISRSHRRYIHTKGDRDVVQLRMRTRHVAGCKGALAGNQKMDIKFVWPSCITNFCSSCTTAWGLSTCI